MLPLLPRHNLSLALLQPQIAPNTGNIARLCVASGTELHLVRPLGFVLSDRNLRRSAMDYWPRLQLTVHEETAALFEWLSKNDTPFWLFTTKAHRSFWDVCYGDRDALLFGSETAGISEEILASHPDRTVRIPQAEGERCLNLSTAAGIALFEALRQRSADRMTKSD